MASAIHDFTDLRSIVGTLPQDGAASPAEQQPVVMEHTVTEEQPAPPPSSASRTGKVRRPVRAKEVNHPSREPVRMSVSDFLNLDNAAVCTRIRRARDEGSRTLVVVALEREGLQVSVAAFVLAVLGAERVQLRSIGGEGIGTLFEGVTLFRDELMGEAAPPPHRYEATRGLHGFMELIDSLDVAYREMRHGGGRR